MQRNTDFALMLRITRSAFGLTHGEMAALLGVPEEILRRWEVGEARPRGELLQTALDSIEEEVRRRSGEPPRDA